MPRGQPGQRRPGTIHRHTDKAESVKRVAFRVDGAAPVTTAVAALAADENGPATVSLNVDAGEGGSGAVLTEPRVDGSGGITPVGGLRVLRYPVKAQAQAGGTTLASADVKKTVTLKR